MVQSSRPAALLAALLIALATLALLWWFLPAPQGVDTAPDAGGQRGEPPLQWHVGRAQRYRVAIDSAFLMAMPGAGSARAMNLAMQGNLDFLTLGVDAAGASVGMRFDSLSLAIDGASDAQVNRALESPFRVRFDRSGRPLGFEFPATLAQEHRDILENTVRMFQLVLDGGDSWDTEESNANGRYRAHYERAPAGAINKHKSHYLPSITGAPVPEVESVESIALAPGNDWLTSMTLDENIVIADSASVPVQVTNLATIELLDINSRFAAGDWAFPASPEPEVALDPRASAPALSPREAQQQLAVSVEELQDAVDDRSLVIHRLRDLLRADDSLPQALIETLRSEELADRTRADIYLAFELAGTPASQAALVSVLADSNWPPADAMRAIVALGGMSEPTDDTLATLWGLALSDLDATDRRDLPGTAALAIGSIGNSLRQDDAPDYAALRAELLVSASTADAPAQRAVFLYALANTADPDRLLKRDLVSYLDDPSAEVRSAAARTLERLGADQVAAEVLTRARQESSAQARASMLAALGDWQAPTDEAMQWARVALQQEGDEQVRYQIAVMLGNNLDAFPENRVALQALLESEQSKRIRQKVANMLY